VRACLKRSCPGCETPHHQVDHGNPDPRLGRLRQGFEVFTQSPLAIEPAEGTLDDPAPLQDLKTLGMLGADRKFKALLAPPRRPPPPLPPAPPPPPARPAAQRRAGAHGLDRPRCWARSRSQSSTGSALFQASKSFRLLREIIPCPGYAQSKYR
jgi:hypothetical protein